MGASQFASRLGDKSLFVHVRQSFRGQMAEITEFGKDVGYSREGITPTGPSEPYSLR